MRLAILHFHLQTGGVTRVIRHACEALTGAGYRILVMSGEPPQQPMPVGVDVAVVPGLAYEERRAPLDPAALAAELTRSAGDALGGPPELWHVHNHCLGKNLALPGALALLARRGHRMLLQPHDFAEDGRPALYQRMLEGIAGGDTRRLDALLYPIAPQVHYAVINERDRRFLAAAGIPPGQCHLLPNAVAIGTPASTATRPGGTGRLWLYPTRAIRRKNLGELLLWATVGAPGDRFAATQAPQNPVEQPRYRRWVALAEELKLPVEFGLGQRVDDFPALLASSHALMTTSVGEGFGLAFLEPWLIGRALVGRDLPEITADFRVAGIDLSALYPRLDVPLDWVDAPRLRRALAHALKANAEAYQRRAGANALERAWQTAVAEDLIDFGRLDEVAQETVLRRLVADASARSALVPATLETIQDERVLAANRTIIERDYSVAGYARHLHGIYQAALASAPSSQIHAGDGAALLDCFLAPERLSLLRT